MEIIGNVLAYIVLVLLIVAVGLMIAFITKKVIKAIKDKKDEKKNSDK